jgi:hypothetical protein
MLGEAREPRQRSFADQAVRKVNVGGRMRTRYVPVGEREAMAAMVEA